MEGGPAQPPEGVAQFLETVTTNQGVPVIDDVNSLRVAPRGPTVLEDFRFREKITHFDHERIPERVVHARGSGARGKFKCTRSMKQYTRAAFLRAESVETDCFVRFSTVLGERGSTDLARDVRGFAVKFYTEEGVFDLVGNNIPIFFIQDAIQFPDLVHAAKPEPDRSIPQAQTAHDTFWDFISAMPESIHMACWAMSDRTIPRSYRMMEGFGVNTFRLINDKGEECYTKFHWRPRLGVQSVTWDEALKISGADPDFHRRDLWISIENGMYPEYDLALQIITKEQAESLPFDVLDATKFVPEELCPLTVVGTLTLNANPENFFAETEQIAMCPSHVVPGIDFSDDPLLQGRVFSYLDTQISRLGGPNFHQLPVNQPRCPWFNMQRDGMHQMSLQPGVVTYNPSQMDSEKKRQKEKYGPRANVNPAVDIVPRPLERQVQQMGSRLTYARSEKFRDHYSQARQFVHSLTPIELRHMERAFAFELGKVGLLEIRGRMLAHLAIVDKDMSQRIAEKLGWTDPLPKISVPTAVLSLPPSPSISMIGKYPPILKGRTLGILRGRMQMDANISNGFTVASLIADLTKRFQSEGAIVAVIAQIPTKEEASLRTSPSVLFDSVVLLDADVGYPCAADFARDAVRHCKAVGHAGCVQAEGPGIVNLSAEGSVDAFFEAAKKGRFWERDREV